MEAIELQSKETVRQHNEWKAARARLARLARPPIKKPEPAPSKVNSLVEREFVERCLHQPAQGNYSISAVSRLRISIFGAWRMGINTGKRALMPMDSGPEIVRFIIALVSKKTGISKTEIISHRHHAPIVRARQTCFYLIQKYTSWSYPRMAEHIGKRDHTTALASVKRLKELMQTDTALAAQLSEFSILVEKGIEEGSAQVD